MTLSLTLIVRAHSSGSTGAWAGLPALECYSVWEEEEEEAGLNICEVAASPARTGGRLVSDLVSGVTGESTRSVRAKLCGSRIRPEPPRSLAMEMMEGDVTDKLDDMSSVYDFDPITGNIPATKVEITVSCRYDVDSKSPDLSKHDFLGQTFCTLGEIVGSPASRLEKSMG
ncbi:hypothetical protein JOQ06_014938, partial [Pogonophryne albipinna]